MSEYIGSRISLISKSDIKYIGTLHEINSDTHTVALESVTSYGTEGRKGNPAEEIPGSDQVYEYIVFRGSDVKELTIVAPPSTKENQAPPKMPDDPAILASARPGSQSQQPPPPPPQFGGQQHPYPQQPPPFGYPGPPPPNSFPNQPRFQGPGGAHGFPGSPGAVPGYGMGYGPPPGYYGPPPGQGFQRPPQQFPPNQQMPTGPHGQPVNQQPSAQQQPPPIGSKSGTPQPTGSNGPTPAPPSVSQPAQKAAPPLPNDSKPAAPAASTPSTSTQPAAQPKAGPKPNNRVAVPLPASKPVQKAPNPAQPTSTTAPASQPQSIADATQAATAAVAAAMAKLGSVNQPSGPSSGGAMDNLTQKVNQMRVQEQQRGRGRGRGGTPRGGRRESGPNSIEVPKEDYDFEGANAKFNKQDLVKDAIASGSPISTPQNGEVEHADANGLAGDKEEDVVIPTKPSTEKGYDKQSSFFDNISSDLKDRREQMEKDTSIDGRAMRREERSKNMETFGQGSVDQGGYRGGFRGRGRGGRGFGNNFRGGGYRGGRGGYETRGGEGFRGRGGRDASGTTFA